MAAKRKQDRLWIEALEERALLSALAPSEADPRGVADIYLNVSPPSGAFIQTDSSPLNILFDSKRDQLIVIEANEIERFDASDGSWVGTIATQSDLLAADISPDGQFLYVLNSWELRKINLDKPSVFKRIDIPTSPEMNLFDVAASSDGVIVSQIDPSQTRNFNPVSRISLVDDSTEALVVKEDGSTFFQSPAMLARSADFSSVSMNSYHEDYSLHDGVVSGREDIFGPLYSTAVSRDGALHALGTVWGTWIYKGSDYQGQLAIAEYRVAFSPAENVLFAAYPGNSRLVAYDASTLNLLYSMSIPEQFDVRNRLGAGHMAISTDGGTLFLTLDNGVRMFDLTQRTAFYGQDITFGGGAWNKIYTSILPTGAVTILDGDQPLISGQLDRGNEVVLTRNDLSLGTHWMSVQYSGDDYFQPGTSVPVKVVVEPAQANVDLSVLGYDAVRVAVTSSSTLVEGGTITLLDGNQVVKTVELTSPTIDIPLDLPPGPHALRAVYSGTQNIAGGRSQEGRLVVPYDSSVTLTQSKADSIYSQQVVFAAKVSSEVGSAAGGSVAFFDGEQRLAVVAVDASGKAGLITKLSAGEHEIHAEFSGTSTLKSSKSASVTHHVQVATTTTSLSASLSDESLRVVAKVTANSGVAVNEGGVTLLWDGMAIDFLQVKNGQAVFEPDLFGGNHVLTASYIGNSSIAGSTSSPVPVNISKGLVSVKLVPDRNWTIAGNSLDWKVSLDVRRQGGGYPEGQVLFFDGKQKFWDLETDSREPVMRLSTPPLKAGEHRITVKYVPSVPNWSGASTTVKVTVAAASTVDLLVLYTYKALNDIGSQDDMRSTIDAAVKDTNDAMLNSHIPVRIELVRAEGVDYRESGSLDRDLERLARPNDRYLDVAQKLRKQYGADLVSLMEVDGDLGGVAYELSDLKDPLNSAKGYSVVLYQQAAGPTYTLAHELGHNFGATHDEANAAHPGATEFSHGYRFKVGRALYHDIMSYDPGRTIQYYSNPRITFKGVPTGTADSADAARTITITAPYVARYMKRPKGR